jgi:hypothetical protein
VLPPTEQLEADRATLIEALDGLGDVAPLAARVAAALEEGAEFEALLDLSGRLEDAKRIVGWMLDAVNAAAIRTAPDRFTPYPVPGGGLWKVSGGKQRKRYDNEALVKEVAQRTAEILKLKAVVTEDGEPGEPLPVFYTVAHSICGLVGATAPSFDGWRSGIAKELGIDLKAFAELEDTPYRARIEGRATEE